MATGQAMIVMFHFFLMALPWLPTAGMLCSPLMGLGAPHSSCAHSVLGGLAPQICSCTLLD
eukprot:2987366-Lingulodinium_polyedra.AAC.1